MRPSHPSHVHACVQVSRVIHVIGRTVLMIDDESAVLNRLWCLWEVWQTRKLHRSVVTLGVPSGSLGVRLDAAGHITEEEVDLDEMASAAVCLSACYCNVYTVPYCLTHPRSDLWCV